MFNVIIEFLNPDNILNKTPIELFESYKPFKIEYKQNRKIWIKKKMVAGPIRLLSLVLYILPI